ncbi:MAG TPA: hypothetical protein VIG64_05390 [Actinomycetota bacterium]|jgi:hypothetical protein
MRYVATMAILMSLVFFMAGGGSKGLRASRSILVVVGAFIVFVALFALLLGDD